MARIFITGSTDGLGRAAAQALIQKSHQVVLHARSPERAAALDDLAPRGPRTDGCRHSQRRRVFDERPITSGVWNRSGCRLRGQVPIPCAARMLVGEVTLREGAPGPGFQVALKLERLLFGREFYGHGYRPRSVTTGIAAGPSIVPIESIVHVLCDPDVVTIGLGVTAEDVHEPFADAAHGSSEVHERRRDACLTFQEVSGPKYAESELAERAQVCKDSDVRLRPLHLCGATARQTSLSAKSARLTRPHSRPKGALACQDEARVRKERSPAKTKLAFERSARLPRRSSRSKGALACQDEARVRKERSPAKTKLAPLGASEVWLGRRDSNPNNRVQSAVSYR